MRKLIILLALCQGVMAQPRENKPLPIFTKKPIKVIDDNLTGWSFSLDGQWVSQEMTIPPRLISTNEDAYETRVNSLGNDNIEELQLYPILYGTDTLVMLVKIYTNGQYEYESTQRGWDDYLMAYYFVVDYKELQKLSSITSNTSIIELNMRDFGRISNVKKSNTLEMIKKKLIIKDKTDRFLTFTARKVDETSKVQFQFASLHDIFNDVEGVLNDFQIRGKSVYGNKELLNYMYYEIDFYAFQDFFSLPTQVKFDL